jgi:hypothetical protein
MSDQEWFVQDWYPMGHRVMDTAVEGSCKTMLGCWLATCTATGEKFLGQDIQQGSAIIIDEETPVATLEDKISRFALSFGYLDWQDLPITIESMKGFRFARKTAMDWLVRIIDKHDSQPMLLRLDSVLAMLPGFRQGMVENDSSVGIAMKEDLDKLLLFVRNISISAHSKKAVTEMTPKQMRSTDMQAIVRGHGSIVGEAADTGIVIKKISEYPNPTRFVLITKARRKAIPLSIEDVFVELKEESYGKGWARLERIDPIALPPTKLASDLFQLFNNGAEVTAEQMVKKAALYSRQDVRAGIEELVDRRAVINCDSAFTFLLNPLIEMECEVHYWHSLLEAKQKAQQKFVVEDIPHKKAHETPKAAKSKSSAKAFRSVQTSSAQFSAEEV